MSSVDVFSLPDDVIEHIYEIKKHLECKEMFNAILKQIPTAAQKKLKCWAYNGDIYWGFGRKVTPKNGFYTFK